VGKDRTYFLSLAIVVMPPTAVRPRPANMALFAADRPPAGGTGAEGTEAEGTGAGGSGAGGSEVDVADRSSAGGTSGGTLRSTRS
jgi:hypothetical protein